MLKRLCLLILLAASPAWASFDLDDTATDDAFVGDLGAGNGLGYPVTIGVWVKYTDHPAGNDTYASIANTDGAINDSFFCRTGTTDGSFEAVSRNSAGGASLDSETLGDPTSLDGDWFPIVCYLRGDSNRQIYVNGTSGGNNTTTRALTQTLRYLSFGADESGSAGSNVSIAEIAIWNSDLSGANRALYEGGTAASGIDNANLVAYWSLSTNDTTPDDESGNGGPTLTGVGTGGPTFNADHPTISGGGPSFSAGPTVAAATNGYTISGTITGANATVYAAALNPGAAAPADCDALQALSGSAPIFASEAWTADAADSFALTAAGSWPRHDVYVCADDGTNDPTALSSFADQNRSADSGQSILVLTSVAATSIFDDDAYFGPDVATGDVVEYDTASSIGCTIAFEADGDFTVSIDGGETGCDTAGELDDRQNFDYNVQDVSDTSDGDFDSGPPNWSVGDDTVWINNTAPVCDGDEVLVFTEDQAISAFDLDDDCTDADGEQLTYTVTTGTLPTGISLTGATGAVSGTPTTENESGATIVFTATDAASDTDTVTKDMYVINTVTLPDYTDSDESAAITEHIATFPWQSEEGETLALTSQYTCSDSEAENQVLSQDPAASTEVTAFQAVTITVSTGTCGKQRNRGLRIGIGINH